MPKGAASRGPTAHGGIQHWFPPEPPQPTPMMRHYESLDRLARGRVEPPGKNRQTPNQPRQRISHLAPLLPTVSHRYQRVAFSSVARLESYRFGRVTVDGSEETRDLIVLPDRVVTNWWRRDGHSLVMEDLEEVLGSLPERLIVGIGAHGRLRPDPDVVAELERRGTAVECLRTDAAVRRYGELDERRTAAALHLTC